MTDSRESATRTLDARDAHALSDDWLLHACSTVEHEGRRMPSLGKITLLERIGRGGMGVVYRGLNPRLGAEVAVKVLPPDLQETGDFAERFVREARLAARLRSEHLVAVLDVDRDEVSKCHFLVMELVRGVTAAQWIEDVVAKRAAARESDALDLCAAATKGLAAAHAQDIVHRDVKPGNVLIPADADGSPQLVRAKLADLGLARGADSGASLTGTQMALGTPGYMAPEQAQDSRHAGKPADVFSMGATLYALLTGAAPFRGSTPVEALLRTVHGDWRPVRELRTDLSDATVAVVERCLAPDPTHRFPDADALLEALEICRASLGAGASGAGDAVIRIAALARSAEVRRPPALLPAAEDEPRRREASSSKAWPTSATVRLAAPAPTSAPPRTLAPLPSRGAKAAWVAVALVGIAVTAVVAWPHKRDEARGGNEPTAPRAEVPEAATSQSRPDVDARSGADVEVAASSSTPPASERSDASSSAASWTSLSREEPREDARREIGEPTVVPPRPAPSDEPRRTARDDDSIKPSAAAATTPPADPVEAAQEFDLAGLPGRDGSFAEEQLRKLVTTHRRGDLAGAASIQRRISQFYLRIGEVKLSRAARDRAELLDGVVAERARAAAVQAEASRPHESPDAPPPRLDAEGRPLPPPPPPPRMPPPKGGGGSPPPR